MSNLLPTLVIGALGITGFWALHRYWIIEHPLPPIDASPFCDYLDAEYQIEKADSLDEMDNALEKIAAFEENNHDMVERKTLRIYSDKLHDKYNKKLKDKRLLRMV